MATDPNEIKGIDVPSRTPSKHRPKKLSKSDRDKLYHLLLTRQETGLTDSQIAERLKCSRMTVSSYKRAFIEEAPHLAEVMGVRKYRTESVRRMLGADPAVERVAPAAGQPVSAHLPLPPLPPDPLPPPGSLSIPQLLDALGDIIQSGPMNLRVNAVKALAELKAAYRPEDTLGPPRPLTDPERVLRLARLIDVCSDSVVAEALERAKPGRFTPSTCENLTPTPSAPSSSMGEGLPGVKTTPISMVSP